MVPESYPLDLDLDISFCEIVIGFKSEGQKNYKKIFSNEFYAFGSYFCDKPKKTAPKIIMKEINQPGKSQPRIPSKSAMRM